MKAKSARFCKVVKIGESIPSVNLCDALKVQEYWAQHIATRADFDPEKEHLYVFVLNTKYHIKGISLVSIGSLNESIGQPREIFRPAIAMAGFAIILCHNNPSGDPTPSNADLNIARKIQEGGKLLGIELLDSISVGNGQDGRPRYYSAKESGVI